MGIARRNDEGVELRVHPTLIPEQKPIATVDGVLNAVMISGSAVGEVVLVGPGAGGAATASSVCADIIDIARHPNGMGPAMGLPVSALSAKPLIPPSEIASEWYLRLTLVDRPGVVSEITQILADWGISIELLLQKEPVSEQTEVPIVLLTHMARESVIRDAVDGITALDEVGTDFALLRVESFE